MRTRVWLPVVLSCLSACVARGDGTAQIDASGSLAIAPSIIAADGVDAATVRVRLTDRSNAPIEGAAIRFSTAGADVTLANCAATDATGTCTSAMRGTRAGVATVSAAVALPSGYIISLSDKASVTLSTSAPSLATSSLTASPSTVVADGHSATVLTFKVHDSLDVPVPTAQVLWSSTGTNNVFGTPIGVTDANGVVTTTLASTHAENKTITAKTGNVSLQASVAFKASAAAAANSGFSIDSNSQVADGVHPIHVTLYVRDPQNNPVSGVSATFVSSVPGDAIAPAAAGVTDANGLLAAAITSTVAGARTLSVQTAFALPSYPAQFVPGPPAVAASSFAVNPNLLDTRSNVTGHVTLVLRDQYNNIVPNYPVTLSALGVNLTYAPASLGNVNGAAVYNANVWSDTAQTTDLTASFAGVTMQAPISFFSGVPDDSHTTLSISPNNNVPADPMSNANVNVVLRDSLGYPLVNYNMSVNAVATHGQAYFKTTTTDSSGFAMVPMTSNFLGPKSIAVHAGGVTLLGNANFVAPGPACASSMYLGKPPMHPEACDPEGLAARRLERRWEARHHRQQLLPQLYHPGLRQRQWIVQLRRRRVHQFRKCLLGDV